MGTALVAVVRGRSHSAVRRRGAPCSSLRQGPSALLDLVRLARVGEAEERLEREGELSELQRECYWEV